MNLFERFERLTDAHDCAAIIDHNGTHNRRELLAAATELADRVVAAGGAGGLLVARVSAALDITVALLAAHRGGFAVVYVDPDAASPIGGLALLRQAERDQDGSGELTIARVPGVKRFTNHGVPIGAQVFLTSGSTGSPVGVVRSAEAILADAYRVGKALSLRGGALVVSAPLFHNYGFNYGLMAPLLSGTAVYQLSQMSIPSQLARCVAASGAQTLISPPTHYGLMAAGDRPLEGFATLANAVTAGAPLGTGVAARISDRYRFNLRNCYGSSEAGAVTLYPVTGAEPDGDIGRPLPGVALDIEPVAGLQGGELLVRTSSLASGVLSQRGVRPLDLTSGWYRTGDVATEHGGRVRLLGRLKAFINVSGKKVDPARVVAVLAQHRSVADVAVSGVADPQRGEIPVAWIVRHSDAANDATPEMIADLTKWCRARLDAHEVPRAFEFIERLERTPLGKVVLPGGTP